MNLIKKVFQISFLSSVSLISMCKNDSPMSPVNGSDLIGNWVTVEYNDSWDYGDSDKGSEITPVNDTSEITVITPKYIKWYNHDDGSCYYLDSAEYTLSGNNLLGDYFAGSETDSGITETWSTTVSLSGDQCTVTMRDSETGDGWGQSVVTLKRYNGPIVPSNWPQDECGLSKAISPKHFKHNIRKLTN